uniref:Uncharacterized protein n=1 Tax=Anopheles merus TaxID=30066 RepID=A0A182VGU0_ANOME
MKSPPSVRPQAALPGGLRPACPRWRRLLSRLAQLVHKHTLTLGAKHIQNPNPKPKKRQPERARIFQRVRMEGPADTKNPSALSCSQSFDNRESARV